MPRSDRHPRCYLAAWAPGVDRGSRVRHHLAQDEVIPRGKDGVDDDVEDVMQKDRRARRRHWG